ncbi:hypothetical protein ES703_68596 [subsurface metagenome]
MSADIDRAPVESKLINGLTISLYNQTHLLFSLHIGSKDLRLVRDYARKRWPPAGQLYRETNSVILSLFLFGKAWQAQAKLGLRPRKGDLSHLGQQHI